MIDAVTRFVARRARLVLVLAVVALAGLGLAGAGVADRLQAGGYVDPQAEAMRTYDRMSEDFHRGGLPLVLAVAVPEGQTLTDGAAAGPAAAHARAVIDALKQDARVESVVDGFSTPTPMLVSEDKRTALIVAAIAGGESEAPKNSQRIVDALPAPPDSVTVTAGGQAYSYNQINEQSSRDLLVAEAVAIPITFLVLVWVFGGLIAAAIPVLIGIAAIIATTGILRAFTDFTDVSIFALNLTTAMGLALAIDYTLLVLSRYREEVIAGRMRGDDPATVRAHALRRTMNTAGRTVIFSAVIVGLSLAAMAIFPMYFLRSFAYAGVAVVLFAALATLILTPAILTVLGDRVDALKIGRRRAEPEPQASAFYRITRLVLRRAIPIGVALTAILVLLGTPFLSIHFGFPDDRVLPSAASSHQVGDTIRTDFGEDAAGQVSVVLTSPVDDGAVADYATRLSRVDATGAVVAPTGTYLHGNRVADGDPTARAENGTTLFTVSSTLDPLSPEASDQLDRLREVPSPAESSFGGSAQLNRDSVQSILDTLPTVLLVIAVTTFILLFLLTGSVVLPLKALVMNVISLTAVFGALVAIFQWGWIGGLGTTVTGAIIANMPVLMFCIAFGLSMDYEVFLLSRIKEFWDHSPIKDRDANDEAVAMGIARTGRVVTAAALLMAIVFAAIGFAGVSFMKMFGVGMMIAVLLDATIIRMLLVPAFMRVAGTWNWWAPAPLRRLHERVGLRES
ncbi:MMPL domain protein OS=Tsukamurella paurometabola (strain ATCC 8368 / DSM / CCUG 35730 / CIP 100753 / JCM 10117 / KCTC 9821 / NBRC 16120 / NCIMB 702349/ NCTC 13040) OX=521096 GN=Tpau_0676 PE=4 SV=1 [Tsukamurella paurometabola]|uniref:MMPL domain protein n=1 Tax=Tsukamurella paurometabola (strain ATCC 8368 / DSM 20162 / CCUG 35730 / CIP 100753 / JCM 10117 / KCTC 9821 / NBRC 16120 / NCIMB 702349 / NCTC 13040) TaxID=521096 RepID=D5UT26_TSUPD|nr:MMPL family transporter [Tsukamurella paurometabola]ADG77313.1 MMPL domain protein [Tsukamurella paurometabola DSM 20162]SUP43462.1 Putative membrane protein ydgH [Tsukamurella paurometabola]